jgi:two-component system NarL family sensor kinase
VPSALDAGTCAKEILKAMDENLIQGDGYLKPRDVNDAMQRMSATIESVNRCFRAIADGHGTALAILATDGRFMSANYSAARILGCSATELIGRSLPEMVREADRPRLLDCFAASAAGAFRSSTVALEMQASRDTRVLLHVQPVLDGRGTCTALLIVFEESVVLQQGLLDALMRSESDFRRLYAQLTVGQERERKRLGAELHDGLGQALTLIKLMVEDSLSRIHRGSIEQAEALLNTTLIRIRETIGEVRHICNDLRPRMLDDLGLIPALEALCKQTTQGAGNVLIAFDCCAGEGDVPDNLKADIFRIAQEAVSNGIKHAMATEIRLILRRAAREIVVSIQDDGIGFDHAMTPCSPVSSSGLGLLGMRERVEASGGCFMLNSKRNAGTLVSATWKI